MGTATPEVFRCYLCEAAVEREAAGLTIRVSCQKCGGYTVTQVFLALLPGITAEQRKRLSSAVARHFARTGTPLDLDGNWESHIL